MAHNNYTFIFGLGTASAYAQIAMVSTTLRMVKYTSPETS